MRKTIHPEYRHLDADLSALPRGEYTPIKTFCNNRNKVELVSIQGTQAVVKIYKKTNLITGLIYTFFRKSKARRAYEHALELLSRGISTPFPIAYFEERRWGIFRNGYFVSEYVDLPPVSEYFYSGHLDDQEHDLMADNLSRFTLTLHSKGIIPLDYNTTNILFKKEEGRYKFTLIDINRMKIGRVPKIKAAMMSFFQLGTYPRDYYHLLAPYVNERNFDFEDALYHVILHRRNQKRLRRFKRLFRPSRR
ncbi:MAG: lipopolysaccharide kinase InaA family protein [Muribaculaceae bacterium]|nr:lipopolysaccharide kinase InaA family protein [Muribaculaceae bacterium]